MRIEKAFGVSMDTVLRIDALGVGDGPPSQPVVVNTVTVGES